MAPWRGTAEIHANPRGRFGGHLDLVGLLGLSGNLAAVAGSPVVTPSSVTITFDAFVLGTGDPLTQSYSARFDLEPQSTT